ncbi:hypothetical protein RvY_17924-2 [Ramazzottius varieornatus]|uniref:Uncharacterized protein n=1 Tax=Ramazzottius varieornatus TaxID=947166 RepID=A0A1D1W4L4_RAMVA|nr:hypothetical protein RvY_17924-2 [Ramazzottius varieornatus]
MENQSVSTGPSDEPVVVSSNPSSTGQKGRPRTPTYSSAQFSDPMLNNAASTSSHTSFSHNVSSQHGVNVLPNTSQNGSTKPSTQANPQYPHQKLDDVSSNLSHVSSSQSMRSQTASKHKHARDCQSSLFMNELEREKEAARFRAQQASEEPQPKPKLLKPKRDTVIPMMIPSSSVAPEMYIMRKPNAWMRRKFAHPHVSS